MKTNSVEMNLNTQFLNLESSDSKATGVITTDPISVDKDSLFKFHSIAQPQNKRVKKEKKKKVIEDEGEFPFACDIEGCTRRFKNF